MDFDARVARRLRLEAQEQAQEIEEELALQLASQRSMAEALGEWGRRGEPVRLSGPGWSLDGRVVHVGDDVVRLRTATADVDARVGAIGEALIIEGSRAPRALPAGHPHSWIARCRELAAQLTPVVVRLGGEERAGRLVAVAEDHLVLDQPDRLVALEAVVWIRPQ